MDAKTYCLDCIHIEVCGWYPREGCDRFVSVEPLTDEEQRIFLAAMRREEKHCRSVEELWDRLELSSNINLVRVCEEIERKVKKALWTN